jgi:hypothetical protein
LSASGWVGVDLDGTLAQYGKWDGSGSIGDPVVPMLERVKAMLARGIEVRIFTARVSDGDPATVAAIQEWCTRHVGVPLRVTNVKDYSMWALFDDRAVAVEKNTGRILGGELP